MKRRLLLLFLFVLLLIGCYANDPQQENQDADADCAMFTILASATPPEQALHQFYLLFAVEACTRKRYSPAICLEHICF